MIQTFFVSSDNQFGLKNYLAAPTQSSLFGNLLITLLEVMAPQLTYVLWTLSKAFDKVNHFG